jgi:hypothetical protein
VRSDEQAGTCGKCIILTSAPLFTNEADPTRLLMRTHEAQDGMKERHSALPATLHQDANNSIPPAVFSRAARLTFRVATSRPGAPDLEPRHLQRARSADRARCPDVNKLIGWLDEALQELKPQVAGAAKTTEAPPRTAARSDRPPILRHRASTPTAPNPPSVQHLTGGLSPRNRGFRTRGQSPPPNAATAWTATMTNTKTE